MNFDTNQKLDLFSKLDHPIALMGPELRNQIAAGEVIERPASIVKEAIENSVDAGATWIQVKLKQGGRESIEITDNGKGILARDLPLAVAAHATSKLKQFSDLQSLNSFGFRGEALASFAASGELQIISRHFRSEQAYEWKQGSLKEVSFGLFGDQKHGTRISVHGLFSKTPARLNFLKAPGHEVQATKEWLERISLSHPEVAFHLRSENDTDSKDLINLQPESERSRVQNILGAGELHFREEHFPNSLQIKAYWLQGSSVGNSRKIFQIVNQRSVKDKLLHQAIMRAFKQSLLPGQSPAVVLYVTLPPHALDINVHPMKTELRFLSSSEIFHAVTKTFEHLAVSNGMIRSLNSAPLHQHPTSLSAHSTHDISHFTTKHYPQRDFHPPSKARFDGEFMLNFKQTEMQPTFSTSQVEANSETKPSAQVTVLESLKDAVFSGQFLRTYLAFEGHDELLLVDQHAAHERIRFEELRSRFLNATYCEKEVLLLPEDFNLLELGASDEGNATLLEMLTRLGFEASIHNNTVLTVSAIPAIYGRESLRSRFLNLLGKALSSLGHESDPAKGALGKEDRTFMWDETLFEQLASEACHSSIRAGKVIHEHEARSLVTKLSACEHPWNCPHGRPTIARVSSFEFERLFLRRV